MANVTSEAREQVRPPGERLGRAAGILGLGNSASRVIGLVREAVISGVIGPSGELDAFRLAARVPTMIYDLLVGGMLSAALVPVFSAYARPERRDELAQVASAVLSLIALIMGALVLVLLALADPLAGILSDFADPHLRQVLATCLRIISPAVLLFGLTGGVTGLLYALRRFNYTALSGAVFNLGIVVTVPLLAPVVAPQYKIYALPIGIVLGSIFQLAVCAPGLRDLQLRFLAAWEHPAVRRIGRLYLPIALGLVITQFQIVVDGRWASATGEQSVSWMGFATTLIQLPLGLVPVAVSLAALPSLSQYAAGQDWSGFRRVFGRGLRLVFVLLIPATVGLWVLARPLITLLFQHGNFSGQDTVMTANALHFYLFGLPFAGVDFLLNYTFYARQNTRVPATVGVISISFYFITALLLKESLGFLGLVLADSAKQAGHAAIMVALLMRTEGRLHGQGTLATLVRVSTAALLMGAVVWLVARGLNGWVVVAPPKLGALVLVLVSGVLGGGVYLALLRLLGVEEATGLFDLIARRLRRPKEPGPRN